MKNGVEWIYQGVLVAEWGRGQPDLLKRISGNSNVGSHTYKPLDIKGHKDPTKKDRIQLAAYARLLQPTLGHFPNKGAIWLNTGNLEEIDLSTSARNVDALIAQMKEIAAGSLVTRGMRCSECRTCPWIDHCSESWEAEESVCLLYGVTGDSAREFADAGFVSWRAVAATAPEILASRLELPIERAAAVHLAAVARSTGKLQVKKPPRFESDLPIHFYDIETYEGCTYLHGLVRVQGAQREEKQFLAREPGGEADAWRGLLDYLSRDERALVYCWADYERAPVHALWQKYGGNDAGWRHLKDHLIDQCDFVRQHFALPTDSYSIKKVAPIFGFRWEAEDAGGLNSESWYRDWLERRDGEVLKKLLRYNLDDVVAMEVIDRGLRALIGHAQAGESPGNPGAAMQ